MTNVGHVDRLLRLILGAVLLAAPFLPVFAGLFAAWGAWKFAVAGVGVVMIGTALFRFCPAYTVLGINTCPITKK
ncbi:DUF2892 domain-containing protein [Pseudotabrizicola sediminis]|uniref:DUF2892 domain-containing protein n=1 Tax=Pseudotabrizicola sediminis TaxID=2486418 RepID=A0ABY2KLH2_9RHOB|nr:DUF2892 domain-containing protein [Pseudotabrizicola sediminis]TGD43324.1 DUF2892 domain-containing protein [Pseudotabrizicola sediminis]